MFFMHFSKLPRQKYYQCAPPWMNGQKMYGKENHLALKQGVCQIDNDEYKGNKYYRAHIYIDSKVVKIKE